MRGSGNRLKNNLQNQTLNAPIESDERPIIEQQDHAPDKDIIRPTMSPDIAAPPTNPSEPSAQPSDLIAKNHRNSLTGLPQYS